MTRPLESEVNVILTGLIPSKPKASKKEDRGTTVLLFYGDAQGTVHESKIITRGYADEAGEFRAKVPSKRIGEVVNCRIRHAAFEFLDEQFLVMPYGAFHAVKMRPDGFYEGSIRGASVNDLEKHGVDAAQRANNYRQQSFERLRGTGVRLGNIPFLFWLIFYLIGIATFAVDYWILGADFDANVVSVVDALYLSAVTVTTLGYGDIVPTSAMTKILTGLQAVGGVVLIGFFLNSLFSQNADGTKPAS